MIAIFLYIISHLSDEHLPVSRLILTERLIGLKSVLNLFINTFNDEEQDIHIDSSEMLLDFAQELGVGTIAIFKMGTNPISFTTYGVHSIESMRYSLYRRRVLQSYLAGGAKRIDLIYERSEPYSDLSKGNIIMRLPDEDMLILSYDSKDNFDPLVYEVRNEFLDELGGWDAYITETKVTNRDELINVIRMWLVREFGSIFPHIKDIDIALILPGSNIIPIRRPNYFDW